MSAGRGLSVLVVHPEAETRALLLDALRRVLAGKPVHAAEASSPTQALQASGWLEPRIVLLDLAAERGLALDLARALRRPGRLVLGLYNPLLSGDRGAELFRVGVRAGLSDFIPMPVADDELAAALAPLELAPAETSRDARVIVFLAGQGGSGATTLATSTALVLAGSKAAGGVVLVDGSLQFGNAASHLGLSPDRDIVDLLRDLDAASTLTPYLLHHPETGLNLLAAPREARDAEQVSPEEFSRALVALRRRFETMVVDLPSQVDQRTVAALDLADRIHVVTESVTTAIASTQRLLGLLDELGVSDRVRVILNRYSNFEGNLSDGIVAQRLGRPVDRVIPYDRAVIVGANRGTPLVFSQRRGAFSEAVGELAGTMVERSRAATVAFREGGG